MNQADKFLQNVFGMRMHSDSIPSEAPQGTYRMMVGGSPSTDEETNGNFIANEQGTKLFVKMPGNARPVGAGFVEDRNQFILFLYDTKIEKSYIALVEEDRKTLVVLKEDTDDFKIGFCPSTWYDIEIKVMQPCNQMHIYWSQDKVYKTMNVDDPCCGREIQDLINNACIKEPKSYVLNGSIGGGVPNGVYHFFFRLIDEDGNSTNFSHISQGLSVGQGTQGDNIAGEPSGKIIGFELDGLTSKYGKIDIGLISIIGGQVSSQIIDTTAYGAGKFSYKYVGSTGKEIDIAIDEIRTRNENYFRGAYLAQYKGSLILYGLVPRFNIDYQRQANKIKPYYVLWAVPAKEAHKYKGLRPNENYLPAIKWNYVDGTSSAYFVISGPSGDGMGTTTIPGCDNGQGEECEYPVWMCKDTSKRLNTYCRSIDFPSGSSVAIRYADERSINPEYDEDGQPVDNSNNASGDEAIEGVNQMIADGIDSSSGLTVEGEKCACDTYLQILLDLESLFLCVDCDSSMKKFIGHNRDEMYRRACDCDNLKDANNNPVYAPDTFKSKIRLLPL